MDFGSSSISPRPRLATRLLACGVLACAIAGFGVAFAPGITILVVGLLGALVALSFAPRSLVFATFTYLILQDLVLVALRNASPFDQIAKFADDGAVLTLGLVAALTSSHVRSLLYRKGLLLAIVTPYVAILSHFLSASTR